MSKIAILDMGLNNIKSIYNLSFKFSETYVFSERSEFKKSTDMLILPGNGNFGKGMEVLNDRGLTRFIRNIVLEKNNSNDWQTGGIRRIWIIADTLIALILAI